MLRGLSPLRKISATSLQWCLIMQFTVLGKIISFNFQPNNKIHQRFQKVKHFYRIARAWNDIETCRSICIKDKKVPIQARGPRYSFTDFSFFLSNADDQKLHWIHRKVYLEVKKLTAIIDCIYRKLVKSNTTLWRHHFLRNWSSI